MVKLVSLLSLMLVLQVQGQDLANIKNLKPFELTGSIQARLNAYRSNLENPYYPNYGYILSGSPTLNVYGIAIPFSFLYSSQQTSVLGQPFNQFGISPSYHNYTLHVGYHNYSFSKYALGGYQIFGVGGEMEKNKWRLGFCYGRLKKMSLYATDSSSSIQPYSYTRKAISGLIRYGSSNKYMLLNVLKAQDDVNSISEETKKLYNNLYYCPPSSNLVIGTQSKFPLFIKQLTLESESAISYYTTDITSPIAMNDAKKSTLLFNGLVGNFIHLNTTSHYYTAFEAKLNYHLQKGFHSYIQYKRIDPNYESMGVYYLQGDVQNILFGMGGSIFHGKIRLDASIGKQNDNLNQVHTTKSVRWISSANGTYTSDKFGIDFNFMNFSSNQIPSVNRFADSLRVTQTTNTFNVSPHCVIANSKTYQLINLMLSMNTSLDLNPSLNENSGKERKLTTHNVTASYSLNLIKQNITTTTGLMLNQLNDHAGYSYKSVGMNTGINKSLCNKKVNLGLTAGMFRTIQSNGKSINHTVSFNAGYAFTSKLQANLLTMYNDAPSVGYIINLPNTTREFRSELNINYTF